MNLEKTKTIMLCATDVNSLMLLTQQINLQLNNIKPDAVYVIYEKQEEVMVKLALAKLNSPQFIDVKWEAIPSLSSESSFEYRAMLSKLVQKITSLDDSDLNVVITGSDPTLGYYLNIYLSLYGRKSDALQHLYLVQDQPKLITIPWIKLTNQQESLTSFPNELSSQHSLKKYSLLVDLSSKELIAHNTEVTLPPALFSWYSWLALRKTTVAGDRANISIREMHHLEYMDHFKKVYGQHHYIFLKVEEAITKEGGFTINYMSEKKTRINNAFSEALGINAEPFHIESLGERPHTQYSLLIDPKNISINDK